MADCGFYGKLPSEGDFLSRRLPWEFTSAWDDWLQQGLQASRASLGPRWLALYLSAPVWRFQLAAGICGPQAWRGLFFSSVDRVGRYFPLTLAVADAPGGAPAVATLTGAAESWLACEDRALAALDPKLALDEFDRDVQSLTLPPAAAGEASAPAAALCLYTAGTDVMPATTYVFAALPSAASFAALLAAASPSAPEPTP
jgi:type VI secretion system protein ImpM